MSLHKVLVISLSSPLLVGVYKDDILIDSFISDEKTSDTLPKIFDKLLKTYKIDELLYARGPGSFMAIKITYIFLRTLSIVKNIPLVGSDGFSFNSSSPIKAVGSRFFMKINGSITVENIGIDSKEIKSFKLPKVLDSDVFTKDSTPLYILPAV